MGGKKGKMYLRERETEREKETSKYALLNSIGKPLVIPT